MKPEPIVSVVIPTYNRCDLLVRAVNSALTQTEGNIEVIIADDGSTDSTPDVISAMRNDRLVYLPLPHGGACAARNAGIRAARGKYIAFLDSDDLWRPGKIQIQIKQIESSGADVVFCSLERHSFGKDVPVCYPGTELPEGQIFVQNLLGCNLVSTQTIFGRADCIKATLFDESFPRMQDWEFAIRLAGKYKLYYFQDVLADVYLQKDSITARPELGIQAFRLLLNKYRKYYAAEPAALQLLTQGLNSLALQCGTCCIKDYISIFLMCPVCKKKLRLLYNGVKFSLRELFPVKK